MPPNGNGFSGKKKIPKPKDKIDYDLLKKTHDIVTLAANFYMLCAMKIYAENAMRKNGTGFLKSREKFFETLSKELDELSDKVEKIFFAYLLYAILTELQQDEGIKESKKKKCEFARGFLIDLPRDDDKEIITYLLHYVGDSVAAQDFCEKAKIVFEKFKWRSGFGGKKWAGIADTMLMRIAGKIDAVVFVDNVFNIEHHGGHVFDKHDNIDCDDSELRKVLDIKRDQKNLNDLYKPCRKNIYGWVKKLFERGAVIGWWKEALNGVNNEKK